jgi:hypothetical protein
VTDEWSASSRIVYGDGETKSAVTDLARVPELLVRILQDPRTENKTVFCWEDEVTQNEAWAIAVREAPEGRKLLEARVNVSVTRPAGWAWLLTENTGPCGAVPAAVGCR